MNQTDEIHVFARRFAAEQFMRGFADGAKGETPEPGRAYGPPAREYVSGYDMGIKARKEACATAAERFKLVVW